VIEPIDVFGGSVFDLLDGTPRSLVLDQLGFVQTVDRLGERVIVRIPMLPTELVIAASARRSEKRTEVNWAPASLLSRIRLNSDYAEVCVKPRICGDGLLSWELLVDFSA
jgi:hypothetical protein